MLSLSECWDQTNTSRSIYSTHCFLCNHAVYPCILEKRTQSPCLSRPWSSGMMGKSFLWHRFSSLKLFPSEYCLPNYAASSRGRRTRTWIAMRPSWTYFLPVTPHINLTLLCPRRWKHGLTHAHAMTGALRVCFEKNLSHFISWFEAESSKECHLQQSSISLRNTSFKVWNLKLNCVYF